MLIRSFLATVARLVPAVLALLALGSALGPVTRNDPVAGFSAAYAAAAAANPDTTTPWTPTMRVMELGPQVTAFCDGRDVAGDPAWVSGSSGWITFGSMAVGICVYVVHDGADALVLDSMPSRAQAAYLRDYMTREHGSERFTLVLSHWHLGHVGGNSVFADGPIVASRATARMLAGQAEAIRAGRMMGPPALPDLTLPNVTFDQSLTVHVGAVPVDLSRFRIHTDDGILAYLPEAGIGLVGDYVEDTVVFVGEPENVPTYLSELVRLRQLRMPVLLPNHGNPEVIASGGYDVRMIDAAIEYQTNLLTAVQDDNFLDRPLESFIPQALAGGVVTLFEPYRGAHAANARKMRDYWHDRPVPVPVTF